MWFGEEVCEKYGSESNISKCFCCMGGTPPPPLAKNPLFDREVEYLAVNKSM